jgi:hypothetical protein
MRVSIVGRSDRQRGLFAIRQVCEQAEDKADAVLLRLPKDQHEEALPGIARQRMIRL